jgi:hypothetical protein
MDILGHLGGKSLCGIKFGNGLANKIKPTITLDS